MKYTFGCARPLYEKNIHPRVLIGPDELADLRARTRSEASMGGRLLAAMRRKVLPQVAEIEAWAPEPGVISPGDRKDASTPAGRALLDIALLGVLDGNPRFITAAAKMLAHLPTADRFCLAYELLWTHLSPDARRAYVGWALEACIRKPLENSRVRYYRSAGGNITLWDMMRPLSAILAIQGDDGAPDLSAELADSLKRFEATLNVVFTPDGYPEEDIGYGTQVAGRMAVLAEATRRAGVFDAYRQCPRIARFGQAILHFVQPWGQFLSNTGDHGDDFDTREFILARLATETHDPALLWLLGTLTYPSAGPDIHATNQARNTEVALTDDLPNVPSTVWSALVLDDLAARPERPVAPASPTQFCDRRRGLVSLRSGWGDDDTLVIFDGAQRSPAAQGHAHDSCGHFSLSALGEYFAIDTGRYNIEQNCHNVVLVDGQSGRSTEGHWRMSYYYGRLTECQAGGFVDFASVDSSHQHNCYWAWRSIGLVKGSGAPAYLWTIEDINKANDWGEYVWQLHTSPENTIEIAGDCAVVRGWRRGNLLDVHFALPGVHEYPKPHTLELSQNVASPSSYHYIPDPEHRAQSLARRPSDQLHHAGYVRPRLLAKVGGYNGRFMSLMLPRRKDEAPARVERLASLENTLAVRITFAEVEDIVIYAYDHDLLEAADVRGRGLWCVVRRSRGTGQVLSHALGNGISLEVAGTALVTC